MPLAKESYHQNIPLRTSHISSQERMIQNNQCLGNQEPLFPSFGPSSNIRNQNYPNLNEPVYDYHSGQPNVLERQTSIGQAAHNDHPSTASYYHHQPIVNVPTAGAQASYYAM
jgi:hypothetical protein